MGKAPDTRKNIIFLCSYNSVRSQIAEGLMKDLYGDRFDVCSAGVASGGINPYTVKVLREKGIDISGQRSKSVTEYKGRHFDYIVTLCDSSGPTLTRYLSDDGVHIHQNFTAVTELGADEEVILNNFRKLRDEIRAWLLVQFRDS
ncbi:MAG TPA: arsenate reductase ArsC [Methanoregulaceae archaeon]|nr:arsenate reductase ArsC [Methanoregulaceae archaeon]